MSTSPSNCVYTSICLVETGRRGIMVSNDEVERRGASPTINGADLLQSPTPSLAYRRRAPRSLEPIVRRLPRGDKARSNAVGERHAISKMNQASTHYVAQSPRDQITNPM